MEKFAIGIDLGGTNLRLGVVSSKGRVLQEKRVEVGGNRSPSAVIELIKKETATLNGREFAGIGIGAPGIVDFEKGVIIRSPHFPEWKNFELRKDLETATGLKVALDNDANMIAAGEAAFGTGRGIKNFVLITLGTGIGGGIVINGEVFHGDHGFAGEIGHQVIMFDGLKCDCGGKGCWETIVSIDGLKWLIQTSDDPRKAKFLEKFHGSVDKITPKILYEMAKEGDIFASIIWKKFGAYLGAGVASLLNVLGIHTFIIGGGVSNAWEFFISEAKREIAKRTYKESVALIELKKAELGDSAGILGAASQCL